MRFGAVFRCREPYGAVLGYIFYPTVRFGAFFQCRKTYGAVRCGFEQDENPTERFGAVNRNRTEPHRTDRKILTETNQGNDYVTYKLFSLTRNAE